MSASFGYAGGKTARGERAPSALDAHPMHHDDAKSVPAVCDYSDAATVHGIAAVALAPGLPTAQPAGAVAPLQCTSCATRHFIAQLACTQGLDPRGETGKNLRDGSTPETAVSRRGAGECHETVMCQPNFVSSLREILEHTGLAPDLLEIEVTESVLLDDRGGAGTLLALNELGVRVAIDDFGTGYSSLSYLKRLSVDSLKLDRTFVKDLTPDADDDAIASAVISLAHALGITVTAEGVETEKQKPFLQERHCDHLQGFLTSRPLPEVQFLDWVGASRNVHPPKLPHSKSGSPCQS